MTYGMMKSLTRALLIGDNQLTQDNDEMLALLSYAYNKVATESDAMRLWTDDPTLVILRTGPGNSYIRTPTMPMSDSDEMDIDDELGFPVCRYVASFVSRDRGGIHVNEAKALIRAYNEKVQAYMEFVGQQGEIADGYGCVTYNADGQAIDSVSAEDCAVDTST